MSEEVKEVEAIEDDKGLEMEEYYRVNDVLIGCADGIKQIIDGLTSIESEEEECGALKSILATIALEFIKSIERRGAMLKDDELEERRQKDRELTEQDKEIMALVKELQDPNLS